MRTEHVVVVRYDTRWKLWFEDIKSRLETALGDTATRIEHVGSTSVEGMAAKPVIDIDVVIKDRTNLDEAVRKLADIGYEHEGDLGIKGREAFSYKGADPLPAHHLYVCPEDSPELVRHLAFRDWLRTHPEHAEAYSGVKEKGARLYPYNIDGYIEYKTPLIEDIYAQIDAEKKTGAEAAESDAAAISETEELKNA